MQDSDANRPPDKINLREYICRIGLRDGDNYLIRFSGSGFGIGTECLVLTRAKVVGSVKPERIFLQLKSGLFILLFAVT